MEKHPQHEGHVRDTINYVNAISEHTLQQAILYTDQQIEKRVREEVLKVLSDPMVELKVDHKSE